MKNLEDVLDEPKAITDPVSVQEDLRAAIERRQGALAALFNHLNDNEITDARLVNR